MRKERGSSGALSIWAGTMADDLDSVESIFNELASDNLPEAVMAEAPKRHSEVGSVTIAEVDPDYGSWEDNSDLDASELESKGFSEFAVFDENDSEGRMFARVLLDLSSHEAFLRWNTEYTAGDGAGNTLY